MLLPTAKSNKQVQGSTFKPNKDKWGVMRSYQDEPVEAAPSWPAEAAQGCLSTAAGPSEPQHGPGSPQTPQGGHRSLKTQTQEGYSATHLLYKAK